MSRPLWAVLRLDGWMEDLRALYDLFGGWSNGDFVRKIQVGHANAGTLARWQDGLGASYGPGLPASTAFRPSHFFACHSPFALKLWMTVGAQNSPGLPIVTLQVSDCFSRLFNYWISLLTAIANCLCHSSPAEVSSTEWELINLSEQEEDLVYRMYRLVGDRYKKKLKPTISSTSAFLGIYVY